MCQKWPFPTMRAPLPTMACTWSRFRFCVEELDSTCLSSYCPCAFEFSSDASAAHSGLAHSSVPVPDAVRTERRNDRTVEYAPPNGVLVDGQDAGRAEKTQPGFLSPRAVTLWVTRNP